MEIEKRDLWMGIRSGLVNNLKKKRIVLRLESRHRTTLIDHQNQTSP